MARGHPRRAGFDAEAICQHSEIFREAMELENLDPELLVGKRPGEEGYP